MTLRPDYVRMPQILKAAPYIDLEDFRREMTEYATVTLAAYDATVSNGRRLTISEFISGQGHILPDHYNFSSKMHDYLWDKNGRHQPDRMYDESSREFHLYFFTPDARLQ